jgi:peptide/nickel transport system substrate-binding protein
MFMTQHRIEGIEAPDDYTVVFRLMAPATDFPNLMAMPFASPVPSEYLDYLPDSPEFRQHTIANGPYQIVKYTQNREILLERNPVWDARTDPIRPAYVDRIRVRLGVDAQLQLLQIQSGTADLGIEDVPSSSAAPLLAIGDSAVWLSPPDDVYGNFDSLVFNRIGPRSSSVLGRREVRHAIAMAVNKAAIVQVAGGRREARPLHQAVPSSVSGFAPGADYDVTPGSRGDPGAARRGSTRQACRSGSRCVSLTRSWEAFPSSRNRCKPASVAQASTFSSSRPQLAISTAACWRVQRMRDAGSGTWRS